ncbi:hypothetical protein GGX14DRAFT_585822 [Mycena pura]|uniref:Uncharacterized protein n=1 Tax=Mycena pura TaxID=153505 RepID=A0AAD6VU32_9AGAR|nr:hypothetical protein GGX14DRAFT_585822 [Mycena pura]
MPTEKSALSETLSGRITPATAVPSRVPSWGLEHYPGECEDFLISYKTNTALDALCIKDNQKVVLKRVDEKELKILRYLDALRSDARNHTIPLLDVIPYPGTEWTFVVMPYCRRFNSPPFHCRGEFVDAIKQYIDHFPGGKESARLTSTLRTFPMIPELSLEVPYNPFYVDVFQLGLAMSRIIDIYPALEEFRTVAASLTVDDPLAHVALAASAANLG